MDKQGLSALRVAVALGHIEVVEFLVGLGASAANIKPEDIGAMMGSGELHMAGRTAAIRVLLGMGPLGPGSTASPPKRNRLSLRRHTTA